MSNTKSTDSEQNIPKHWAIYEITSPLFVLELMWINATSSLFWTWSSQVKYIFRIKFNIEGTAADQASQDQDRLLLFEMEDPCSQWMWTRRLLGMDQSSPKWTGLRRTKTPRWCHCKPSQRYSAVWPMPQQVPQASELSGICPKVFICQYNTWPLPNGSTAGSSKRYPGQAGELCRKDNLASS